MNPAPHLQENDTVAFDEAHQRVVVVWPEYPGDEPDTLDLDLRAERAALLRGLLMWLTVDAKNAKSIGQRALLLSHIVNPTMSQRQLAKALGLSAGRVSQILSALRAKLNLRP
jgi:Trp operon repressor